MKKIIILTVLSFIVSATAAFAGTTSASIMITATVLPHCEFATVTFLNLGGIEHTGGGASAPAQASGSAQLWCSIGTLATIHPVLTLGGKTTGTMVRAGGEVGKSSDQLAYTLTGDGDGTFVGGGPDAIKTINYGVNVNDYRNVQPGTFTDAVSMLVEF